jgi:hypothetical protein
MILSRSGWMMRRSQGESRLNSHLMIRSKKAENKGIRGSRDVDDLAGNMVHFDQFSADVDIDVDKGKGKNNKIKSLNKSVYPLVVHKMS